MVTYAQLKDMDTSKLASAAANAGDLSGSLAGRGCQVSSSADIPPGMWQGQDATTASGTLRPLDSPLYDVSDSANRGQAALEDLVEKLDKAKEDLNDAVSQAKAHGLTVGPDGTVTTPESNSMAKAEMDAEMAEQIREQIQRAVQNANDADDEASGSLGGEAGVGGLGGQAGTGGLSAAKMDNKSVVDHVVDGIETGAEKVNEGLNGLNRATTLASEALEDPNTRAAAKDVSKKGGMFSSAITGGLAALDQAQHDSEHNSDKGGWERAGRAATRGVLEGGGAAAGGAIGAAGGAAIMGGLGTLGVPGVGTAVGVAAGGLAGGALFGQAGADVGEIGADWALGDIPE